MGPLDRFTWKEYFLIGGLLIVWGIVIFTGFNALTVNNDFVTAGFAVFLGVIFTGVLLILIAVIEKIV